MVWLQKLRLRFWALFRKQKLDAQMDDEMRSHVEMQTQDNIDAGMTPEDARYAALRQFGCVESIKEKCREQRGVSWLENSVQDIGYGARMLRKNPGFTVVAVLTLALGIGANTAIFSVVNSVILRPLPFREPDQLVQITERFLKTGEIADWLSPADFLDLQAQSSSFQQIAAIAPGTFIDRSGSEPLRFKGARATPGLFGLLGISPLLGRAFTTEEAQPGHDHVALLSHSLWKERFGGDPAVVGQSIKLNDASYTVVGVLPPSFVFAYRPDLWVPLAFTPQEQQMRNSSALQTFGRLKPGTSVEQANGQLSAVADRIARSNGWPTGVRNFTGIRLHEVIAGKVRKPLFVLLFAVAFVLLIAAANVANLLLGRFSTRQREFAVRTALGAGAGRLARQFFTENLLVAFSGGVLGVLLATWLLPALIAAIPSDIPRIEEIRIDWRVLIAAFSAALLVGALLSIAGVFQLGRADMRQALCEGSSTLTGGVRRQRTGSALIVGEVALTVVLVAAAGLMVRSFWVLWHVDPGYNVENILTVQVDAFRSRYPEGQYQLFFDELVQRVQGLPGVQAVGVINTMPLSGTSAICDFDLEERPAALGESRHSDLRQIAGDYLRAMGIPLVLGRTLTEAELRAKDGFGTVLINQSFAHRYWPGESPLGKRILVRAPIERAALEVIGVVADTRHEGLEGSTGLEMYVPYAFPYAYASWSDGYLLVRTAGQLMGLESAIRHEILALNPAQPVGTVQPFRTLLSQAVAPRRFNMWLLGSFAMLALMLAAIGIFGVISYNVTHRTREIAIRMALGARAADIIALVITRGMVLTGVGLIIGLGASLVLTRFLTTLLFGVRPIDIPTFLGTAVLLTAVALLASLLPARRATKVNPMVALRYE